jgi:hypothetical protein
MIKVESDMLVLDSSFTKDDVLAINEFIEIAKKQERERIIKLLESNNKLCTEKTVCIEADEGYPCNCIDLIELIKGEQK